MSGFDPTSWQDPPRVLVLDDEEVVCESIRRVLEGEGYEVEAHTSPAAALEVLRTRPVDLLLLDIKMPEMDGIEVLRRTRQDAPDTEVVVITGYATIDTAVEAIKLGAFDYLEKPVSPPQLVVAAARALERRHLVRLTHRLRSELEGRFGVGNIICSAPSMRKTLHLMERVAPTNSTVLIVGETGTGKDLFARAIHYASARRDGPFVVADCASLSESLLESELFGHVRGAFTGAVRDRKGLAESARGGTLFLDEISTVSPQIQGSLLRLLQDHEIRPVGSDRTVPVDVRVVAATNRDLAELVAEGSFREDLYYRLSVFTLVIPPLRQRREDIPLLAHHFLFSFAADFGRSVSTISPEAMAALEAHDWPGNVRELEHTIERAVLLCDGPVLGPEALPLAGDYPTTWRDIPTSAEELTLLKRELRHAAVERVERLFVMRALQESGGNVAEAARRAGMARPNFHAMMRRTGVDPKPYRGSIHPPGT